MGKLFIAMVGLPARGKSTLAYRLQDGLRAEHIAAQTFNNGDLRRLHLGVDTSLAEFYHPDNIEGQEQREHLALINVLKAKEYIQGDGQVAIIDATNASRSRRMLLEQHLTDAPLLFIECVNTDQELLDVSIWQKSKLPEFSALSVEQAVASFKQRVKYYQISASPLQEEASYIKVDTLKNNILEEKNTSGLPFYACLRDIIASDWVNLYLARHGQSYFNIVDRIGGDSGLTEKGQAQAAALAKFFTNKEIPYVFTSHKLRSIQTAAPIKALHPETTVLPLQELDEIDAGICDGMTYEEIEDMMPEEYMARSADKYNYCYPGGEGYATMLARVERGFRKALFLSGGKKNIVIIGHQAVNRMILSLFLFRQTCDVPYIYVPQNQLFYIEATNRRKLFELVHFMDKR